MILLLPIFIIIQNIYIYNMGEGMHEVANCHTQYHKTIVL